MAVVIDSFEITPESRSGSQAPPPAPSGGTTTAGSAEGTELGDLLDALRTCRERAVRIREY